MLFRRLRGPDNKDTIEICLIHNLPKDEWLLPKGRKDRGESIEVTAVRETYEETGYPCKLLPMNMITRAPEAASTSSDDSPQNVNGACEPISVTIRTLGENSVKIIWWFATCVLDNAAEKTKGTLLHYETYESKFLPAMEALERITFDTDREIIRKAYEFAGATDW